MKSGLSLAEIRSRIKNALTGVYDHNEIRNFSHLILYHLLNYSKTDLHSKTGERISQQYVEKVDTILQRLRQHEPIQYILGRTEFFGLPLIVSPDVLIPRPETEELADWIIRENRDKSIRILDLGTGSGCLAVALARELPPARVSACDFSEKALRVAMQNAELNDVPVSCFILDLLDPVHVPELKYDVLVSNPPYVRESEKKLMPPNVLHYEPPRALFVPDADPLVFYRAIADLGHRILVPLGFAYCELNEALPDETAAVFKGRGYGTELRRDINGKWRMIKATLII
jgi:release factor glutamine methyltransferase